ncbi:MAG: DNA sulfur modification protein DndD [Ardenticatenia bacterium]|nr:DNA sulfur modification protein DndD [Ardenticatenia bacterium]
MELLNLTVHNLGVFRGRQDFNLTPVRQTDGSYRHLTVVSGHNGAGKTTLFQALALALHGSLALGDRVSRQAYNDFLLSRLHRHSEAGTPVVSDEGSVALSFQYVQSGCPLRIQVERFWQRNGHNVQETLTVLRDGQRLDVDPVDYQIWLSDFVPPGLTPLCFFDAERLEALANPEQHNGLLGETLRRLLGLDLVERLQTDLAYYTRRRGGGQKVDRLQKEVLRHQDALDALNVELTQLHAEAEALAADQDNLEAELVRQERRLLAEGGSYADRRPVLQERLLAVQKEIETTANQLRELSAGLLPFALAPELCQTLSQRLVQEADMRRHQAADQLWQEQVARLEAVLQGEELWHDVEVPLYDRTTLAQRLVRMLRERETLYKVHEQPVLHHLAEPEQEQLQGWIAQALRALPQQVQALGQRMQALRSERRRIEEDLSRAPDDEILAPIHAKIMHLETDLSDLRRQQKALNEQTGALRFQRDEQARQLQRMADQLAAAQANERQLELAERSKLVLKVYQDALTRQQLGTLEEGLVAAFNAICRKEHLLIGAFIEPNDFHVQLHGTNGHILGLGDFSAGERQLYAMALLWALRQVSGRQLPLAMDTPLARLDEIHRWRLMHDYVPAVSAQVLLFATDAELDPGLLAQAKPYLARVYHLDYDSRDEATVVTCDIPGDN